MARQGLSGRDLAHLLGVTEGRVSQMLKGDQNFTLRSLAALSAALEAQFQVDLSGRVGGGFVGGAPKQSPVTEVVDETD